MPVLHMSTLYYVPVIICNIALHCNICNFVYKFRPYIVVVVVVVVRALLLLSIQEAVDLLKRTGRLVNLQLYRYPKGLKFQQVEVRCLYCPPSSFQNTNRERIVWKD